MGPVRPHKSSRESQIHVVWTAHLKDETTKKEFLQLLANSNGPVLERLLTIVRDNRKATADKALSSSNYESPSWAYTQADNVGFQRALSMVEALLKGIVTSDDKSI